MNTMTNSSIKSYPEMVLFDTFEDRFQYLKLSGTVGRSTFAFDRHVNQKFYTSNEWQDIRSYVIVRDEGCDLGILDRQIGIGLLIHHMNPMTVQDILDRAEWILNPDFLITTSKNTHNAIHFGADQLLPKTVTERTPGDTRLW